MTDLGTVAAEPVVGYVGGWTPLAKIAATITAIKTLWGRYPYTAGEDYLLEHGGLTIPLGSTIPIPEPGAPNIQVDYTFARHTVTEAFVHAAQQYTLVFTGMNEARSGKPVRVIAHKISGGVLSTLGLLGRTTGPVTFPARYWPIPPKKLACRNSFKWWWCNDDARHTGHPGPTAASGAVSW